MKNEKKPFDSKCKMVKIEVVFEDAGVIENGAKMQALRKYSFAHLKTKLWKI
jgi:hypothetical protein